MTSTMTSFAPRCVKNWLKIPNRLGKNFRKPYGGDFFLTHTVDYYQCMISPHALSLAAAFIVSSALPHSLLNGMHQQTDVMICKTTSLTQVLLHHCYTYETAERNTGYLISHQCWDGPADLMVVEAWRACRAKQDEYKTNRKRNFSQVCQLTRRLQANKRHDGRWQKLHRANEDVGGLGSRRDTVQNVWVSRLWSSRRLWRWRWQRAVPCTMRRKVWWCIGIIIFLWTRLPTTSTMMISYDQFTYLLKTLF